MTVLACAALKVCYLLLATMHLGQIRWKAIGLAVNRGKKPCGLRQTLLNYRCYATVLTFGIDCSRRCTVSGRVLAKDMCDRMTSWPVLVKAGGVENSMPIVRSRLNSRKVTVSDSMARRACAPPWNRSV